jgi:hypothetical protein
MKETKCRILALVIGLAVGFLGGMLPFVIFLCGVVFSLVGGAFLAEVFYSKSPVKMRGYVNWFYAIAGFLGGVGLWDYSIQLQK